MDEIRLRYTGLTAYTASLTMMLTGLLFTLLITRRLTPEELGVWRYIGTLISYFIIPANLLSFWVTRLTAQGRGVLSTSIAVSAPIIAAAMVLFVYLSETFAKTVGFIVDVFLIASLEIPSIYLYMLIESATYAVRPHLNYYSQLMQEAVKLPLGLLMVVVFRLGLQGALWAAVAGFTARSLVMLYLSKNVQWGRLDKDTALRILRLTWLPLYASIPNQLIATEYIIVLLLTSSAEPLGYATALYLIGSMVTMSGSLASGLYPKMLQKPNARDVEAVMKLVLMFATPTAVGAFLLSSHILNILRPDYVEASPLLPIVLVGSIISVLTTVVDFVIVGEERSDFADSISSKKILRSRLFLQPSLNYLYAAIYLPSLTIALYVLKPAGPVAPLTTWFTANLATSIIIFVIKLKLAREKVPFTAPLRSIAAYITASTTMSLAVLLTRPSTLPPEIASALPQLLHPVVIGAATYLATLYVIDKETRELYKAVLRTLAKPLHK